MNSANGMSNPAEFRGKRVLVTGGTKGIGRAVVERLRAGDAAVLATARNRADASPEWFVAADITTAEGCAEVTESVMKRLGGIDIIVHVAGGSSAPAGVLQYSMMRSGNGHSISIYWRPYAWIVRCCRPC